MPSAVRGTASFEGATITPLAPISCAIWEREITAAVPAWLVPTRIGKPSDVVSIAVLIRVSLSLSVNRLDSPKTPMIVIPSTPDASMKRMLFLKEERSRLSSEWKGVAMIGNTPLKGFFPTDVLRQRPPAFTTRLAFEMSFISLLTDREWAAGSEWSPSLIRISSLQAAGSHQSAIESSPQDGKIPSQSCLTNM